LERHSASRKSTGILLRERGDLGLFPPLAAICGALIGLERWRSRLRFSGGGTIDERGFSV